MSNIAGKAYAWNVLTPINGGRLIALLKKLSFRVAGVFLPNSLKGLRTLSTIHYARWVIVRDADFPCLSPSQPREKLRYSYMFFFSDFNGAWEEYVDAFAVAIPTSLNLLWWHSVAWPTVSPMQPFHRYIVRNQLFTNHYYSAYPMASSNDIKGSRNVRAGVSKLAAGTKALSPPDFQKQYLTLLKELQHELAVIGPTPIVSLAAQAVEEREREDTHKPS
jgi:hypothetical protein